MEVMKLALIVASVWFCVVACSPSTGETIESPGGNTIDKTAFTAFVTAKMDTYAVPGLGVALISGGEVAYQQVFGVVNVENGEKVNQQTMFEAASLSKPVFAHFVMKQVDKGLIALDTPLYRYVSYPDIAHDERYKQVTTRRVLTHTTGLPNWRKEQLAFLYDPGTRYAYSGEGFQYLARALAAVNQTDRDGLHDLFKQEVALPLDANRLYFAWNTDVAKHKAYGHKGGKLGSNGPSDFRTEEFGSAHNLHTDLASYAHFIAALISGKNLSRETHLQLLERQVNIPDDDYERSVLGNTHWSLGFAVKDTPHGPMYSHGGNNGYFTAFMLFYPDKEFGMVLFSNSEKVMFSNFTNEIAAYLETDLAMDMEVLNQLLNKSDD